jgi:4-hydroxy-tetrahydrodipicolinate synthase
MSSEAGFRGVYVPVITPFAEDGSVATEALTGLCHRFLDAGVRGIVALGTTGEASSLDSNERRQVIEACADVCFERGAQLIVGAGSNNTSATVAAVKALVGTRALAAALIVVPYYVRPSDAGIVAHFRAVADASPVPLILYNIAIRTGRNLSAAGVVEAARHPNIVGIKQAAVGLDVDTLELLAGAPDDFAVLGGEDPFLLPVVLMGGVGAIAASAHVCTERFVAMIDCGLNGNIEEARRHAEALLPVIMDVFAEPNPAVFKSVLHAQGHIPTPDVRLPLMNASSASTEAALTSIASASV